MTAKEHANLISIFAWIMAGWELLLSLLFLLYTLFMGAVAVGMALDPKVPDAGPVIFMGAMAAILGLITLFGLTGSISNFLLGRRLRAATPPTQKFVVIACIINFASVFTGGMFTAALGGYALWFATSDQGKAFFAGQGQPGMLPAQGYTPYKPNYAYDPERMNWR